MKTLSFRRAYVNTSLLYNVGSENEIKNPKILKRKKSFENIDSDDDMVVHKPDLQY